MHFDIYIVIKLKVDRNSSDPLRFCMIMKIQVILLSHMFQDQQKTA